MESKKQLLEVISKAGRDRSKYLSDLFKYIPEAIAKEMTYTEVPKNEYLLFAGKPSDTVFILLNGHVIGLDHHKRGKVYSFMDFTEMYIIGDFEIFGHFSEYCVSIRTTEPCKLLKISSKSYLNWIQHDADALFLRLNNIMTTLIFEKKMDHEFLLMSCKERLASFLIRSYEYDKKDSSGNLKISKTQAELADKVGFNVRSVQRSIIALENENFVSNENGKIIISQEQYLSLKQYVDKNERR